MTKIYEALQQASKERTRAVEEPAIPATTVVPQDELDVCLLAACNRIDALLERQSSQVVAVVGVPRGDNSSKIVHLLAQASGRYLGRNVLIVNTENRKGNGRRRRRPAQPTAAALPEEQTIDTAILTTPGSSALNGLMTEWRKAFDLVLIDLSYEGTTGEEILCSLTDGVVLVVEAEITRWQSIKHKVDLIAAHNGRVLGTILNKQHRYIPDFLYTRL
jgi:Mrp family chromosome partitioning ATPase